jgi:hypothetical protein
MRRERPRRAQAQGQASRLELGADREPIRPKLWRLLTNLAHDVQHCATADLDAFVDRHRHRRVLSGRGRDLTAYLGKRDVFMVTAKLLPEQIKRVGRGRERRMRSDPELHECARVQPRCVARKQIAPRRPASRPVGCMVAPQAR